MIKPVVLLTALLSFGYSWSAPSETRASEVEAMKCAGPNAGFVARVMRGEFTHARASWWGFDAHDATKCLQAALDSRVPRLLVDAMPSPWIITPVVLRSNMKVVVERGAVIAAKPGAFLGLYDALLSFEGATNVTLKGFGATLRMRREEYTHPPYARSEWRYGLRLHNCRNVKVEGLTVEETGGDGACIYGGREIVLRECVFRNNHRQGISVGDAEDLLIERCRMEGTCGTPPMAGIDFEPDDSKERLKNIVVRDCVVKDNQGSGFQVCLNQLTMQSEPVSILIDSCRSEGNGNGTSLIVRRAGRYVTGEVRYRNCTFSQERHQGIGFEAKPVDALRVVFENCTLDRVGSESKPGQPAVLFYPPRWDDDLPGNVSFDGLTVIRRGDEPWIGARSSTFGARPRDFTGRVKIVSPDGSVENVVLDDAYLAQRLPLASGERPEPRRPIDFREVKVVDGAPGQFAKLTPIAIASWSRYVFYANAARRVCFKARQLPHGPNTGLDRLESVLVNGMHSSFYTAAPYPQTSQTTEIAFDVPTAGWYTMRTFQSVPLLLEESNVPVAVDAGYGPVMARLVDLGGTADFWFDLPDRRLPFSFVFSGTGGANRLKSRLVDSANDVLVERDRVEGWTVCNVPSGGAPGLAALTCARASASAFYYFKIDVTGLPPYLFLTREKCWHWNGRTR